MRIRELTLENYRVFGEPRTFEFGKHFTVVAGINGRGKTAILDAIALLASRLLPHISAARGGYRYVWDSDVHVGTTEVKLSMKVTCVTYPLEFAVTYKVGDPKLETTHLPPALKREIRNAYGQPEVADDAAPLAVYYTTDRAGYRLTREMPKLVPLGQSAAYLGALTNRTVNFRDFMRRYQAAVATRREVPSEDICFIGQRAVDAISGAIGAFLGGFGDLRVQERPPRLLIHKDGTELDLTQLSDGERAFLALVCDLSRRLVLANPRLDHPLTGFGVVLIDEIELHLHPKWQREVVDKLRRTFPNIQFIVTTHSPFIVQSLRPGELIYLDSEVFAEYADKSIEDISENVMGVDVPQKSERYVEMMREAESYFRLLGEAGGDQTALTLAESKYEELASRFSDDPAFQAYLKLRREIGAGGHRETGA